MSFYSKTPQTNRIFFLLCLLPIPVSIFSLPLSLMYLFLIKNKVTSVVIGAALLALIMFASISMARDTHSTSGLWLLVPGFFGFPILLSGAIADKIIDAASKK